VFKQISDRVADMQNGIKFVFSLSLMLLAGAAVHAQNPPRCLSYEPTRVQLTGRIIRKTFPGPPNYKSIEHGDAAERTWLLVLPQPICIDADKTEPDFNLSQKDIRQIQLVFLDTNAYQIYAKLVGKNVVANGTLFGAHTGHQHTPVLLTVKSLTAER